MKKIYKTQQRRCLIDFLSAHGECTTEEIIEEMTEIGAPARSSVYRLIKQLVEEGVVKRYTKDNSRKFVYELVGEEECRHHLHLKCMRCGKMMHLSQNTSLKTKEAVLEEADFYIDQEKTILFGICKACKRI